MVNKLKFGMVGGADGSFIGGVHRRGAGYDGLAELAAGCFSRNPEKNGKAGAAFGIDPSRIYTDYKAMAAAEGAREDGIDFVTVATPNNSHYEISKAFLEAGISVACDKPFTFTSGEALELTKLAESRGLYIMISYTYTGYAMVRHARKLIDSGAIGDIFMVNAEYLQGWGGNSEALKMRAEKRGNPAVFGPASTLSDVGTHIEATVREMTGLEIKRLTARMEDVGKLARDTSDTVMLEFEGGASGLYWASQISIGYNNGFKIRVFGSKGTLEWYQEDPNYLKIATLEHPPYAISSGSAFTPKDECGWRLPAGHPEGFYEAFANLYTPFERAILKSKNGEKVAPEELTFTDGMNGYYGMRFVERCLESVQKGGVWVDW